jgi:hypothetical protein
MAAPFSQNLLKSAGDLFTIFSDNGWNAIVESMKKFFSPNAGERGNFIPT